MNNIKLSCIVNELLSTHYIVYKIINTINGKYYIGQHQTNNIFDDYMGSGTYLDSAKIKYRLSTFEKTILFDFATFEEMDNKEAELVQLSNCYPYDQMSYNLIPGGNGWHLTPEICKQRGITYSENYQNKSEEEKQVYKDECKRRAIIREQNKTNEQRDKAHQKQRETWKNKTDEEIQLGVVKWRKTVETRTDEQREEITRKRLATLNQRSDEEKQAAKNKFKNTIASKSPEQKKEIRKKLSNKLKEHYKKHPEKAKKHSKRMTGKGNPAFGRKWMNNGKEHVYVKAEEIQHYLDKGYKMGRIKIVK